MLRLPTGSAVTAEDAIAGLLLIPSQREALDIAERHLIEAARDRGETWESLGTALGGRTG